MKAPKILFILFLFFSQVLLSQSGGAEFCDDSEPLCGSNVFSYPNTSGAGNAEAGPDYGCLGSQPNPAWFFLQIEENGDLVLNIEQSTVLGGAPNLDVDFIIYGPFADSDSACSGGLTFANIVDCSYSPNNTEQVDIPNAISGEFYVLLITNFSDNPGFITVSQISGTGSTNCGILADIVGCDGDMLSLDATTINATSYVWYEDDGSGNFVVIPGVNTPTYSVTNTNLYKAEAYDAGNTLLQSYNFNVAFYQSPSINPNIMDVELCDDDGIVQFDLTSKNIEILNGMDPNVFEVTYYLSMADANAGTNALPFLYTNSLSSEMIFARVTNKLADNVDCFDVGSFNLNVFISPVANEPLDYIQCNDTVNATFDLSTKTGEVLGTQSAIDFDVKFYYSQPDADAGLPGTDITLPISNSSNPQIIVARIENKLHIDCYTTTSFDLIVNLNPLVVPVVDLFQCDDDSDGITLFNLTEANNLISNNAQNETITYYLTDAEAQTGFLADQISNYLNYQNPVPLTSIVYARVEASNECFKTSQINLIVSTTQIPGGFNLNYNVCDDYDIDNDNTNGIAAFDFSDATAQIESLFLPGQNLSITYYINIQDALEETNPIADISNYRNDTSPFLQNIVVRVDDDAQNACVGLGEHITLTVDSVPENNAITDYVLCEGMDFDLSTKDSEVTGTQTQDILVSYHESMVDAQNNVNPIISPYSINSSTQAIYVRAQFDDNGNGVGDIDECFSTDMSFDLVVNANPLIYQPDPIQICSEQVGVVYDLTIREDQITGGDNSIILSYFETQTDLDNNNPITVPTAYFDAQLSRDILVLATGSNMCVSVITLSLVTILYENINIAPTPIEECEVDNDGYDSFDLTRRESEILNGLNPTDFSFLYYEDEADAIAGNSNNISDFISFVNTQVNMQIIYARVKPVANECFRVVPLTLIVNPVPEIDIEDEYVICLSSSGQAIEPVLSTELPNPPIDTHLSPLEYTFQWYHGEAIPGNEIIGEIDPTYSPTTADTYSVIATNIVTGCTIPATTLVTGSYPPESISVDILTDAFSSNDILEVNVIGGGQYEYKLDDGSWQDSPRFEGVSGGMHILYVRDLYNCNQLSAMQIVIDYPRFFTPNKDGYNDNWNIVGMENQPSAKIFIYDRYGKLIKQLSATSSGWDGTFNGDPLPSSDYWFTVEYLEPRDGILKIFKSHFALKR